MNHIINMATALELLQQFRNSVSQVLFQNAPENSIKPEIHANLLSENADAMEAHINDQDAHGAGSLPVGSNGGLMVFLNDAWGTLPAGTSGQELFIDTSIPTWKNPTPFFTLAYESDGYCYSGVEMDVAGTSSEFTISIKNCILRVPHLNKKYSLALNDVTTFKLNLTVTNSNVYVVILKSELLSSEDTINITLVNELTTDHIVLLERKIGSGTSSIFASGLLVNLATDYRLQNTTYDEITPTTGGIIVLDVTKNDKIGGRFYVKTTEDLTISTKDIILSAEGIIVAYNPTSSSKTISFTDSFFTYSFSLDANKRTSYSYFRLPGSSRFNVLENINEVESSSQSSNIIANKGIGLLANIPSTGLTIGDIYVATDSLLKFTAIGETTWDTGTALTTGAFINDTLVSPNLLYQYNGSVISATGNTVESSGGSAYLLTLSENPTYNADDSAKIIKHTYVSDPTKYYEERFEYTNGLASKIEMKDDLAGIWVQKTDIYNSSEQLQKPTLATIEAWTII